MVQVCEEITRVTGWPALTVAVLANVIANISFKLAVKRVFSDSSTHIGQSFVLNYWTWIGVFAGFVLLGSYLLAIRDIQLGFCYAVVTSFALVIITVVAHFVFQERMTLTTVIGTALVVAGIAVLASKEFEPG